MHCLIVSCVYPPEPVVSAQTSSQLAVALANINHRVSVLTSFPSRPLGNLFPGFSRKLRQREWDKKGLIIDRCFSTLSPTSHMVSRLMENLSFGLSVGWQVMVTKPHDVIYANTWPIVALGILFLAAKVRRIPLVISVQDVYPESLIAQQRIEDDSVMARIIRWIDGSIARHSAHVIVISENFADIYRNRRRVPSDRLSMVPNWIDGKSIDIRVSGDKLRLRKGIHPQNFLLVYGGNIGVAAGVDTIIESMRYLGADDNVRLLVAGGGSQLAACKELAGHIQGERIFFHSPWLPEETSEVLRSANVLLLPTQRTQSLVSVPSKLLSYMLAARPLVVTAVPESNLADLVKRSQCGWVVAPDRPDLLAEKIREIMQIDPAERTRRGDMGREYVLRHFTKEVCLPKVIKILENAVR